MKQQLNGFSVASGSSKHERRVALARLLVEVAAQIDPRVPL